MKKVRFFSISRYVEAALRQAEYERDEEGIVIGQIPGASGFFAQGDTFEETCENLRDVIEGNVLLALQLGIDTSHHLRSGYYA
jgi:predicted RNase H-like HicB family nuclease